MTSDMSQWILSFNDALYAFKQYSLEFNLVPNIIKLSGGAHHLILAHF